METNNKISEIIQKNFISKISYFSKYNSEIKISENSDFMRVDSMLPSDTFNICVLKNKNSLEKVEVFQEITEYFNKKSFPAAVWLWNDNCASKERMEESGFGLSGIEKGMYIDTCKIKEKDLKYEGFTIEKVSSGKQMEDFSKVIASIFGETEEAHYVKRQYDILGQKKIYTDTEMTFFVGYFDGTPVSCGTVYVTEESTGIYDVAVKEDCRKKGFGSAMFAHLMGEAKKNNTKYCILQASSDGAGIYRKMGFTDVCDIDVYENRDFL
jgi:ribosomal protein S18 acetylase RimI-like enzyme